MKEKAEECPVLVGGQRAGFWASLLLMLQILVTVGDRLKVYTRDVHRPAKAQRPHLPCLTFPIVQAQEAKAGW